MPKRCEMCNLDLQDEYSYQGHIQGKRHLKNAEQLETVHSLVQRSIFVSRIPPYIPSNNLLQFFAQFGEIIRHRFAQSHLILEYKNKDPVEFLLSRPIYFSGIKLNIRPRVMHDKPTGKKDNKNKSQPPEAINDTEDLIYDNIKSIFEVDLTFDEQLAAFLQKVACPSSEIEKRYEPTCARLDEIFRNVFPQCKAYRFGSTVSGLGFKNCDLDIYMDIGCPVSQENSGNVGPNVVTTAAVFTEVKRILYARSNIFSKIVPIPRAKTPIIKFMYMPTKISCDISFKNSLAVHNSQLIKFYLSLDPRLQPAMMILKYWVCNYELKSGDKMSKYALTTLFIFYLQQPAVRLVPPVIELKQRLIPEIVEGWQVNFSKRSSHNWQKENESKIQSIPELLHGFFQFYATFDFKTKVICPVDGLAHSRESFGEPDNLPDSMTRYKEYLKSRENPVIFPITKPMCVQDPNELNHNVTGNVCARYLENFQKYCEKAAEICVKGAENNYKDMLPSIFSLIIKVKPKETNVSFVINSNNLLKVGLAKDFESRTDITDKTAFVREHWFNLLIDLMKKYFEDVLKLQVQFVNQEREQKQQKLETQSDVHSNDQDKIVMHCTGNYCLWRDRKSKGNVLDPSVSLLDKEIQISENIFKILSTKDKAKVEIDFQCRLMKKTDPNVYLIVVLSNNNSAKNQFLELANNIKNKMPHILHRTLVHMQQFKQEAKKEAID